MSNGEDKNTENMNIEIKILSLFFIEKLFIVL